LQYQKEVIMSVVATVSTQHSNIVRLPALRGLQLWWRWVMANAVSEAIGLTVTAVVAIAATLAFERQEEGNRYGIFAVAALVILAGTFEGLVVGIAQWFVLRQTIKNLSGQLWIKATVLSAFIAWTLGMLPSTIISLTQTATTEIQAPPSDLVIYGLSALMGLVFGLILGAAQFLVLRRHLQRAGWWVLANSVAWAVGMPIIFVGAGSVPEGGFTWISVLIGVSTCIVAGAAVGAIHGLFLTWLLSLPRTSVKA
jgi:hypothetical protein